MFKLLNIDRQYRQTGNLCDSQEQVNHNMSHNGLVRVLPYRDGLLTFSSFATVFNYILPGSPTVYYYAKRGCAKWTDITDSEPAVSLPFGYTNVNQQSERSLTPKSNTLQASRVFTAASFECFMCQSEMKVNKTGNIKPIYTDFGNQDNDQCWRTEKASTATSGRCETSCYTTAYKFEVASAEVNSYQWFVRRGCAGKVPDVAMVFGLQQQTNICTRESGTLCNDNFGQYSIDEEVKTQVLEPLKCFVCQTTINNTDAHDACYIKQETKQSVVCDTDLR